MTDDDVVRAALDAASLAVGRELRDLGGLGGSDRSHVHRVADGAGTLVVKGYGGGSRESWARERVGLAAAGTLGISPRLVGAATDPPLVVMEDLGAAPDVAQHLLADDPRAADEALAAWAGAVGRLHAGTHEDRDRLRAEFADEVAGALAGADDETVADAFRDGVLGSLDRASRDWAGHAAALGVSAPPALGDVAAPLDGGDHDALSPADICPDNNMLTADGCRLIDFEWSEVRHPAWDAAYLTVPWPTCWCSWAIPEATVERTLDAYRAAAAPGIPYVASRAFDDDVAVAQACWALIGPSWALDRALADDTQRHPAEPGMRPRIQHRLALVAASTTAAAAFAAEVLERTRSRWGDLELELAPAYR